MMTSYSTSPVAMMRAGISANSYLIKILVTACFLCLTLTACSDSGGSGLRIETQAESKIKYQYPKTIALYQSTELQFESAENYSAYGFTNPFIHPKVIASLRSPSGRQIQVSGFFDGDGLGGGTGRMLKVRLAPDELGKWSWTLGSNLSELNGLTSTFEVVAPVETAMFSHGPVVVSTTDPTQFQYRSGPPIFLIGKFLDLDAPENLQFSHTFFSETLSDVQRQQMLERHLTLGVNKINLYVANRGDYKGRSVTPWLGNKKYNLKDRFDLAFWHRVDQWLIKIRDAGLIAHIWFFADDSNFGKLSPDERQQLLQYGMSRLSAYVNTMFILALEWQETFSRAQVNEMGQLLQNNNPWQRLISVHGINEGKGYSGDFDFADQSWADYMDIQPGFIDAETVYEFGQRNRKLATKPLIIEEFTWGLSNADNRKNTWFAVMSNPAGIGTGVNLNAVAAVLNRVQFQRFEPLKLKGLGDQQRASGYDDELLIYGADGQPFEFELAKLDQPYTAYWINPSTGEMSEAIQAPVANTVKLSAPTAEDWLLYLRVLR